VVVIGVMNGELASGSSSEIAPAPRAHARQQAQRTGSLAVVAPFAIVPARSNEVVHAVAAPGVRGHQRFSQSLHFKGAAPTLCILCVCRTYSKVPHPAEHSQ